MSTRYEENRRLLEAHGQAHLLTFYDDLPESRRAELLSQVESLDLDEIDRLIERYVKRAPSIDLPGDLSPAPYYANDPESNAGQYDAARYRAIGEEIISAGKVAAFTVAGGQGTRLGWNGPKGTFPASPIEGKPLFRLFAEQIRANQDRYGVAIPWYIMTSPINDAATRAFITDNNCFGLSRRNIFMFPQGMMPSFDKDTARILLASPWEIAMNPDGHGGSLRALSASGAIDDMIGRGIEHISYFQVDNPLVKIIDPLFIGLHAAAPDSSAEVSSKMLPKAYPEEKVGVFCQSAGKTMVIEYSDLPDELARQRGEDGSLRFIAGSIAIHLIGVEFAQRLSAGGEFALPWHRAEKKAPFIDLGSGEIIEPDQPNAVKLETFVFDAIPLAESSIVYETTRIEEFAPIKNAEGVDSAESSRRLQCDRNANWLESRGVEVPRDDAGHALAEIEISPLTALRPEDLNGADLPRRIEPGERVVL